MLRTILLATGILLSGIVAAQEPAQAPTADEILLQLAPPGGQLVRSVRGVTVIDAEPVDPAVQTIDVQVSFAFGSAELTPEADSILGSLGEALADPLLGPYSFLLAGHTDSVGDDGPNLSLSEARANSVRAYLISEYGIEPWRLLSVGYGETRLLVPEDPENGSNRRVQITNLGDL